MYVMWVIRQIHFHTAFGNISNIHQIIENVSSVAIKFSYENLPESIGYVKSDLRFKHQITVMYTVYTPLHFSL